MPATPRTRTNPRDYTGRQKALLAEQAAKDVARRQGEIAMVTAQEQAAREEPIQLDQKGRVVQSETDAEVTGQEPEPVQVAPEWATIRIACDLEKVTIGQDNHFDFVGGQVYKVPHHVAVHLDRLGYVWQWL